MSAKLSLESAERAEQLIEDLLHASLQVSQPSEVAVAYAALVGFLAELESGAKADRGTERAEELLEKLIDPTTPHGEFEEAWEGILAMVQGSGWRDISTAPRLGHVLLFERHTGNRFVGRRDYWGNWLRTDGDVNDGYNAAPTHWQPLPAAPEEGE